MANEVLNNSDLLQENLISPAVETINRMQDADEKAIAGRTDLEANEQNRLFEATKKSIALSAQYLAEALKTSKDALTTVTATTATMEAVIANQNEFTDAQRIELKAILTEENNKVFEDYLKEQAERNKSFLGNVWQGIKKAVDDFGHKDNVEQELEEHTRRTGREFLRDTYNKAKEFVHSAVDKATTIAKDFTEKHAPDKDKPGLKEQLENIGKGAKEFFREHIQKTHDSLDSLVQNAKADLSQWKHDMTAGKVMERYYADMKIEAKTDIVLAGLESKWAALGIAVNKAVSNINPIIRGSLEYTAINREERRERAAIKRDAAEEKKILKEDLRDIEKEINEAEKAGRDTSSLESEKRLVESRLHEIDKETSEKIYGITMEKANAKRDVNDLEKTNIFDRRAMESQTRQNEASAKLEAARRRLELAERMKADTNKKPDQNVRNYNRINHEKPFLIKELRDTVQSVVEKRNAYDVFKNVDKKLQRAANDFSLIRGEKSLSQTFGKDELAEMIRLNREISKLSGEIKADVATLGSMIDQNKMNGYVKKLNTLCDRMEEVCHQNALTESVKTKQAMEYSETGILHGNVVRSDATTVKNVLDSLNAPEYANTELITTSNGKVVDTYDRIPLSDEHKNAADYVRANFPDAVANALLDEVAKINNCQSAESRVSSVELGALTSTSTGTPVFDIAVTSKSGETLHNLYHISDGELTQFALVAQSGRDILRGVEIVAGKDAENNLISDLSRQAAGFTNEVLGVSALAGRFVENLNRNIDRAKDNSEHEKDDRSENKKDKFEGL